MKEKLVKLILGNKKYFKKVFNTIDGCYHILSRIPGSEGKFYLVQYEKRLKAESRKPPTDPMNNMRVIFQDNGFRMYPELPVRKDNVLYREILESHRSELIGIPEEIIEAAEKSSIFYLDAALVFKGILVVVEYDGQAFHQYPILDKVRDEYLSKIYKGNLVVVRFDKNSFRIECEKQKPRFTRFLSQLRDSFTVASSCESLNYFNPSLSELVKESLIYRLLEVCIEKEIQPTDSSGVIQELSGLIKNQNDLKNIWIKEILPIWTELVNEIP